MINEYKIIKCKLDGEQTASVPIDIKRNGRYVTDSLDILIKGYLKFSSAVAGESTEENSNILEDKTVVYPVLFTSDIIRIINGRCIITILYRSEDLFETTEELIESAKISDSTIIAQGGIRADEQIIEDSKEPVVITIEVGKIREPYRLSIEVAVVSAEGTNIYNKTIDRGINPQIEESNDIKSLFQKEKKRIASNFIIDCYNDSQWIPSVDAILNNNDGSYDDIIDEINDLQNSTPFGISTMYDALVSGARILRDNSVDTKRKTIYLFTDNEANVSKASINNAIDEINTINGDKKVPVLAANISIVEPETLSIKVNRTDTKNINKISFLTGGQSITITSKNYLDDIVGIFYREVVGSLGYGTYEFTIDLEEEVLINNISASFYIPLVNANATWNIETSIDGYNFTPINDVYNYNESVNFENLFVRYIRFEIILISGLSSVMDEYAYPETPSLTSIQIVYNAYKVVYLYLNKEDVDIQPYQITLAVDANEINTDQVKVGVAKSDSHNWVDYSTDSQPSVNQNGKVVIPIRFSQNISLFQQEPLKKVDIFMLKTEYGSWDHAAFVLLYDKSDQVIPTNYYKLQAREGRIIFNYALPSDYVDGDYKIGIINSDEYKVGIKLTNKTATNNLEIYGAGYLYTTGKDLLPPLQKAIPEVRNASIINETPNSFSLIEATYTFYDSNFEEEDISKRIIRWFINGNHISYLDNLTKWNDITNPMDPIYMNTSLSYPDSLVAGETIEDWIKKQGDSILYSGDNLHFEILVSDGSLFSIKGITNTVKIIDSAPILDTITIKAEDVDGNISDRLATDRKAIIYPPVDQAFFSDSGDNQSEIIWYVNDEMFKRGIYGESRGEGQPPIHEIWVNEVGTGNYIDYGLRSTNAIFVQVIPKTSTITGDMVTTPVVIVQNALPMVFDIKFVSPTHDEYKDIVLTWSFFDFEIDAISDIDQTGQFDQTNIKWYRKNPGNVSELVYESRNMDTGLETFYVETYRGLMTTNLGTHTSIVDDSIVYPGQEWCAEVVPFDGVDFGEMKESLAITITSATN